MAAPFPVEFKEAMDCEWSNPISTRHFSRIVNKLYTLPEQVMTELQVSSVEQPVAALSSTAVVPSEGEGGPKDPCDKCVETAMQQDFQMSAGAFHT